MEAVAGGHHNACSIFEWTVVIQVTLSVKEGFQLHRLTIGMFGQV